ncbi:hypothetical protein KFK09_026515 [Dendrobium nobile]|uniref:X8 domain-containing protein n=1 Tax=Dendrobium nobile TaxID=94219 RepID=A0A8T3A6R0_DENNO|nr:hypothetical protein KFK09_026515 [Dendrobium nobile]
MARSSTLSHSLQPASIAIILLFLTIGTTPVLVFGEKTWCIAKPSSDVATLLANINYACSQVDCSMIQSGHPCFNPDTPISHASIAMNLYYQAKGRNSWNCDFKNSGLLLNTNPSYGNCAYA